jgi:short-chain fatty acids transporter
MLYSTDVQDSPCRYPFFMLPPLGILRLRARDLVGYGLLQLIVQAPIVFFLCWFFARQLPFVPPMR